MSGCGCPSWVPQPDGAGGVGVRDCPDAEKLAARCVPLQDRSRRRPVHVLLLVSMPPSMTAAGPARQCWVQPGQAPFRPAPAPPRRRRHPADRLADTQAAASGTESQGDTARTQPDLRSDLRVSSPPQVRVDACVRSRGGTRPAPQRARADRARQASLAACRWIFEQPALRVLVIQGACSLPWAALSPARTGRLARPGSPTSCRPSLRR